MANAIRLDADVDRLDTETVVPLGSSWSACGWVKIVTDLNDETPIFTIEALYGYPYIALRTDSDGVTPSIKITWMSRASLGALTVGQWYFLGIRVCADLSVSTWSGQAGGSLTRVDDTGPGYTDSSIRYSIGGGYPGSGYLDGSFSRARLWNVEISNAEMDAEFAQDVGAARTSGLVGDWFRPDVTLSTYLGDNSTSNNDLTTSGTHALDTTAPDLGASGSVATADGTSTAVAVGASTTAAAATSTGTSTAAAVGASSVAAVAATAGTSTAAAVGSWTSDSGAVASAAGTSTAAAVGQAVAASAASASGTSTATAVGASAVASVASSAGTSTADAIGDWTASTGSVATSSGTSTALAVGAATASSIATAAGTSTALATSPYGYIADTAGFGRGGGMTCPRGIIGGGLGSCA